MEENAANSTQWSIATSKISGFRLYEEEFEKTPKRSIKRFLYADAEI